jgi:guanosine-3',5'-bis(diphosphate) 3'-pyrophosphohydrolase
MDDLANELFLKIESKGKIFDKEKIENAYILASKAHEGQLRLSGEPYIIHPIAVAIILVDMEMDTDSITVALLHDVVEDTNVSLEDITKEFGKNVAELVDGVTKLTRIPYSSREEQQSENIRKMLLAMVKDIRVIIIKLADRLHNMRTIENHNEKKRLETALETMEVYAPIAHRLGIRTVKEELEDISLKYLDPVAYKEIEAGLARRSEERQNFLNSIKDRIMARLDSMDIKAYMDGRVKSIYGIYRKMFIQGRAFDEIYDIYAIRIIVDNVTDCYNILGIIHDLLQPIPGRFKDYISTPKPNMYQSLHTTLISKEEIPFEVQIRTWDMHFTAEYGIAAHWKYKLGLKGKDSLDERLAWIRQLLEIQKNADDAEDFVKALKTDLSIDEVFVFTPKGDVINLPTGSTVIDFAYAIHSAVGNRMIGAKVDGRIVQLEYEVQNGEIIEILTTSSENHAPSRDWIKICRTSEARSKIRQWYKKERREENIIEGKEELEREFKRNGIRLTDEAKKDFIDSVAKRQHCNNTEDFYAAIGYGGISLSKIMSHVRDDYIKSIKPTSVDININDVPRNRKASDGVIVEGLDNCLIKFSKCCNPLPGDSIIGFVTRGYGVSIHKMDCINVKSSLEHGDQPERWINVYWADLVPESFKASLQVFAIDRNALLADITGTLAAMHVSIHAINARELKTGEALINIVVDVNSLFHLNNVVARLKKINGVIDVSRASS